MKTAMGKAGVSITFTTLTDMLIFFSCAITNYPALKSFSIFAAIGVLFVYIAVMTLFSAFLSYDL
jgi:predicted RND superfamily exporter protein